MELKKQSLSTRSLKKDRGVAGLTILLSAVAMVFIIGFLVMVFAIIGSNLQDNTYTATSVTTTQEAGWINLTTYTVDNADARNFRTFAVVTAVNTTSGTLINSANYTITQVGVVNISATGFSYPSVTFNYTYVYDANNTATESIADTTNAIAGVTSWFPIIITITVMVALILLTVIIIVAIRSSGILAGGN